MTTIKDVAALEALIRDAFRGVTLGNGVSLSQNEAMSNDGDDDSGHKLTRREYEALRENDITDNWELLIDVDLPTGISYMDSEGFRYYIPAYLMRALRGHDVDWAVHYLSHGGDPKRISEHWIALLNDQQKHAIAQFLHWLPYNLNLGDETRPINNLIERGLRSYWGQYLNLEAGV